MKKVPVESIEDGMALGREVCGASGNILLSKGTILTGALGRRLKNWGIPFVFVEGDEEVAATGSSVLVSPQELKTSLMKKFGETLNNPLMKKIFVAVYQYKLQTEAEKT